MTKVIQQTVTLNASPEKLFETYLDSKKHGAVTGSKISMSRKVGGTFAAFDGMLAGKNLMIVPNRMIVQAWRASGWKPTDPDSILILQFTKVKGGGQINLVHVNVPRHDHAGVTKGWPKYYWNPWKAYLKQSSRRP